MRIAICLRAAFVFFALALMPLPSWAEVPLYWHVETLDGEVLDSQYGDEQVNPASVVKVATSLWALSTLGSEHRFTTRFRSGSAGPPRDGRLIADLVVEGSGDPDFHVENAFLVARALNDRGIRHVDGRILVNDGFWIGWEGGSARREKSAALRSAIMARRLRDAFDPKRWDRVTRESWKGYSARRSMKQPPSVVVHGGIGRLTHLPGGTLLAEHRSEPLGKALKRFNVFSNNDIERLEYRLGPALSLGGFLEHRWGAWKSTTSFETLSGLGRNRMTPREIVRMLRDLHGELEGRHGGVADLLPVMGCGLSTLSKLFPRLLRAGTANGMIAKTGTLTTTDGGVSVLAGYLPTKRGLLLFAVVAPGAGRYLLEARKAEEHWVSGMVDRFGRIEPRDCPEPYPLSDELADVKLPSTPAPSESGT